MIIRYAQQTAKGREDSGVSGIKRKGFPREIESCI
jgi:hypothetical protein